MAKLPVRTSIWPGWAVLRASVSAVSRAVFSWACTAAGSVPSRAVVSVICSRSCCTSTVPFVCSWRTFWGGGTVWAEAPRAAVASAQPARIVLVVRMLPFVDGLYRRRDAVGWEYSDSWRRSSARSASVSWRASGKGRGAALLLTWYCCSICRRSGGGGAGAWVGCSGAASAPAPQRASAAAAKYFMSVLNGRACRTFTQLLSMAYGRGNICNTVKKHGGKPGIRGNSLSETVLLEIGQWIHVTEASARTDKILVGNDDARTRALQSGRQKLEGDEVMLWVDGKALIR